MTNVKVTPLTDLHRASGAKMVEFAGYLMPVSYGSILAEHRAVREQVGIFDVSHMGEFVIRGKGARRLVNDIITNDCSRLAEGALQYSVMCREDGTVVDDLLVYVVRDDQVLLVVNASNIEKDLEHVLTFDRNGADVENVSDECALLAVQGPRCRDVLTSCPLFDDVREQVERTAYYHGFSFTHGGSEILVSRTGYTGELGFEILVPSNLAVEFWEAITQAGRDYGLVPVGLGARDTLRFEASFCLFGHELNDDTSPLEVGLGWVVKLNKERFRGIETLRQEKKNGPKRALVGFELEGRNIARQGYTVLKDGVEIGKVTSGAFSPTMKKSLCMALIERSAKGTEGVYEIAIRGKTATARLTPLPFYRSRAK
ncbi:MAG: glycine cleavage system aminomethyltransferase GcvT [Candidatus Latescibacterota bacterium]|nr:MAG: glycine cleavage system aminomethyltransferase GcvT [Candidatus Latescibacterota bacterium]